MINMYEIIVIPIVAFTVGIWNIKNNVHVIGI